MRLTSFMFQVFIHHSAKLTTDTAVSQKVPTYDQYGFVHALIIINLYFSINYVLLCNKSIGLEVKH